MLPLLIQYGADVNACGTNPAGQAALHIAAHHGNEEALRILIDASADVFSKYADSPCHTPLDAAAAEGRIGTASSLLDHGVEIVAENVAERRISPMYLAAIYNREKMVRFLLDRCGSAISEEAKT